MLRTILLALLAALLACACQQIPQSGESFAPGLMRSSAKLMQTAAAGASALPRGGPYGAAIVKDLEIGDANLGALFGAAFRETLQREGFVRLALPNESSAEAVTIQPAAMRISPSELEIAVAVRDARGRLLGWYAVQYSSGSLPGKDGLPHMFADAGEQVAKAIATAR